MAKASEPMLEELPPPVEGRIPTEEEMAGKARNGRYYLEDVWVIEREFPSCDTYACRTDLPKLANKLTPQVRDIGYTLLDSSERLNDCRHALNLTMEWASLVRDARTTSNMHIVRRTPENSGAMLMMQRQEHLRGQCTEYAPVAYIVLVRDEQIIVTRDRVLDQDATERMIIHLAKNKDEAVTHVPNMPASLFRQQMSAVEAMLDAMKVGVDGEAGEVVDLEEGEELAALVEAGSKTSALPSSC